MLFSSKLNDIINELRSQNRKINLFNILTTEDVHPENFSTDDWHLLRENDDTVLFEQILRDKGGSVNLENVIDYLIEINSIYTFPLSCYRAEQSQLIEKKHSVTEQFGYNLKERAKQICLHREDEIRMIKICLEREYKNNVMLIGSSGVGKTFLVTSLAHMMDLDIYYVDISSVLSGTKYRGEFEKKLHVILEDAIKFQKIIFFDEMHMIMQTGNSDGGISAADILKPYLMNNKVKIIGATTLEESDQFSTDKAFERRFNFIRLNEFDAEKTKIIIKNKFSPTEDWGQKIFDDVFTHLDRNFTHRHYPDKAIDFFDFYFAGERLSFFSKDCVDTALECFLKMNKVA